MVGLMTKNKQDSNQQRGVIINLPSTMAYEPPPGLVAYDITKSAVSGMTIPLARGLALQRIRVITICLGYIDSPMTAAEEKKETRRWSTMISALKRCETYEEVAHLIQACIKNPLINDENIRIDMGYRYNQGRDSQGHSKC
ncbi:3-hydroxyacyl-CoA dehydrogenase type-2 [Bombus terrestris]|uniref:3-hydroxyacyl-CoA dehydrogenase type-2 n=1 Tax=Bombus terrestris TaxID=30195 RepID=A0A9B7CY99_BOMTE|nr:3-hydroxyacyl-CoA dehydrogenase type-2 [Bombus terrestris]